MKNSQIRRLFDPRALAFFLFEKPERNFVGILLTLIRHRLRLQPRANPNAVQDVQPQGLYAIDEIKQQMTILQGRIEDLERAQKDQATASKKVCQFRSR